MPVYREDGERSNAEPGRPACREEVRRRKRGRELLKRDQEIDKAEVGDAARGVQRRRGRRRCRSARVLKCELESGVCQACYGRALATGEHGRARRRGRHHRRAVDRRAGHPADDADLPHRRCRRARHHAGSAADRRAVRGAQAEGPGPAGAEVTARSTIEETDKGDQGGRSPTAQGEEHALLVPAADATAASRTATRSRRATQLNEGSLYPAEILAVRGRTETELYLVERGAEGLPGAGRRHQRQAHRADRPPDAEEGADRSKGSTEPAPGPARGPRRAAAR